MIVQMSEFRWTRKLSKLGKAQTKWLEMYRKKSLPNAERILKSHGKVLARERLEARRKMKKVK